jgi:hypothetical protein
MSRLASVLERVVWYVSRREAVVLLGGADEGPFETVNMFESELGVLDDTPFLRAIGGGLFFFAGVPVADGAGLVAAGSGGGGEETCNPRPLKLRFFRMGVLVAMLFAEVNNLDCPESCSAAAEHDGSEGKSPARLRIGDSNQIPK